MKWYEVKEKNPRNKSLVVIWYGQNIPQPVDDSIDITVYNTYMLAFYEDGKWLDIEYPEINLANKYRIDKWYNIPFKHGKILDKKVMLDPIRDRFEILDL